MRLSEDSDESDDITDVAYLGSYDTIIDVSFDGAEVPVRIDGAGAEADVISGAIIVPVEEDDITALDLGSADDGDVRIVRRARISEQERTVCPSLGALPRLRPSLDPNERLEHRAPRADDAVPLAEHHTVRSGRLLLHADVLASNVDGLLAKRLLLVALRGSVSHRRRWLAEASEELFEVLAVRRLDVLLLVAELPLGFRAGASGDLSEHAVECADEVASVLEDALRAEDIFATHRRRRKDESASHD